MGEKMTVVLRQLGVLRKDEVSFGRLINNPRVTPSGLIRQYWSDHPMDWLDKDLLLIEDGSTMSFKLNKNRVGLGSVGPSDQLGGFELHNSLLLDANDLTCYGVGAAQTHTTEFRTVEQNKARRATIRKMPMEEKETFRWFSTIEQTVVNCPGAKSYTVIADQEADIYELMARFGNIGRDFVIRGTGDRRVDYKGQSMLLNQLLSTWEVVHTYNIQVTGNEIRTAHEAKLSVKFGSVELLRPKDQPNKALPPKFRVQIVEVMEDASTVLPGEKPVHWVLITSHPVQTLEQATTIIRWYCARWNIEQNYRTIKLEGLDVEHSEADSAHALANLAVLTLIAAVQVISLVRARDGKTQQEMAAMFDPLEMEFMQKINLTVEGATEKQRNPHPPNSMAYATWVIARLGGWSVYNKKRPPGPITIMNGLVQFQIAFKGYSLRE